MPPVAAVVGGIGEGAGLVYREGVDAIVAPRPMPLAECMAQTGPLLEDAAERTLRLLLAGRILPPE